MQIYKIFRYTNIYGLSRTFAKIMGRLRLNFPLWLLLKFPFYNFNGRRVGIVGAGHHAYSSIAFYLSVYTNCAIVFVSDINNDASLSFSKAYRCKNFGNDFQRAIASDLRPEIVYVASNHASHVDYAVQAMSHGSDVFIEKPIVVSESQWLRFLNAADVFSGNIYVGYNRPFAKATRLLNKLAVSEKGPLTLSFFVTAHFLSDDHWYRESSEGSRVVANMSHWLDMSIHVLFWKSELPKYVDISISYSDELAPSDNVTVAMVSSAGDLITLVFTSRSEPYEGVNETINLNMGKLICKIDDFRTMSVLREDKIFKRKFAPKDNGHKACVLQPFRNNFVRDWNEIYLSTALMLHVESAVKSLVEKTRFYLSKDRVL